MHVCDFVGVHTVLVGSIGLAPWW